MQDDNPTPSTPREPARYLYEYRYKYGAEFAESPRSQPSENSDANNRQEINASAKEERSDEKQDDANETSDANEPEKSGMSKRRKLLLFGLAGIFIVAGIIWLLLWIFVFSQRETTDDAYVGGNQVMVSAKVAGTVIAINADETQRVVAGQVLVRLDPVDATVSLKKAQANLAQAVRQVRQENANADQADALVASRRIELQRARADLNRREPLLKNEAVPPEEVVHAREQYQAAQAALMQAEQQANAARALIDGADIENNPSVQQAIAAFRDAWVTSARNAIVAPLAGYVAQRQVQIGQTIQPGENLFTIVPLDALWIDANFKEGQLHHLRIGQRAEVKPDMYHGAVIFHGHVVGLAPGTGGAFALLPPQNASGNWIKVVQRLPVRVALDADELRRYPLRIGLSTKTTVDTHDRAGTVLTAQPAAQPLAQTRVYEQELMQAENAAHAIIERNLAPTQGRRR
jgi:membrane fusion protein (multidrug efflux system)